MLEAAPNRFHDYEPPKARFWFHYYFFSDLSRSAGEGLQAGTCRAARWVTVKVVESPCWN